MLKAAVLSPLSVSFISTPPPAKTSLIPSFSLCSFHAFYNIFFLSFVNSFLLFFSLINSFFSPLPSSLSFPGGDFRGGDAPSSFLFFLPLSPRGLFVGVMDNHVERD